MWVSFSRIFIGNDRIRVLHLAVSGSFPFSVSHIYSLFYTRLFPYRYNSQIAPHPTSVFLSCSFHLMIPLLRSYWEGSLLARHKRWFTHAIAMNTSTISPPSYVVPPLWVLPQSATVAFVHWDVPFPTKLYLAVVSRFT